MFCSYHGKFELMLTALIILCLATSRKIFPIENNLMSSARPPFVVFGISKCYRQAL